MWQFALRGGQTESLLGAKKELAEQAQCGCTGELVRRFGHSWSMCTPARVPTPTSPELRYQGLPGLTANLSYWSGLSRLPRLPLISSRPLRRIHRVYPTAAEIFQPPGHYTERKKKEKGPVPGEVWGFRVVRGGATSVRGAEFSRWPLPRPEGLEVPTSA